MNNYNYIKGNNCYKRKSGFSFIYFLFISIIVISYISWQEVKSNVVIEKKDSEETEILKTVSSPVSNLDPNLFDETGDFHLTSIKNAKILDSGYVISNNENKIHLTLEPKMQKYATELLKKFKVPWGALVVIEVKTGRVLTLADYAHSDDSIENVATHSGFPAASLFKLVTAAAAIEKEGVETSKIIKFRGGKYSLNYNNYLPDKRRDTRQISLKSALAASCNPAFARLALNCLSPEVLEEYAENFGFNTALSFELPVGASTFTMNKESEYNIARTAAGFGRAYLSPIHAALLASTIANKGKMMKPYLVSSVTDKDGRLLYRGKKEVLKNVILPSTASKLLDAMTTTVTKGTARRQFRYFRRNIKKPLKIAAKTGTLSGKFPKGRYHWFIASAPSDNPEIAIASLVIDPGYARINGTGIARLFMEFYFKNV